MVRLSTIKKVEDAFIALSEPSTFKGNLTEVAKDLEITARYLHEAEKLKIIKIDESACWWCKTVPDKDTIIRLIETANQKANKKASPATVTQQPENLIPFDKAVEFATESTELGIAFGIEKENLVGFVKHISELFKKYK